MRAGGPASFGQLIQCASLRKMWRWLLVIYLVQLNFTSPQPVVNENGRPHSSIECCPCPKDQDTLAATRKGAFIPGMDWPGSTRDQMGDTAGESTILRPGGVDDCPCRHRDADSQGEASILLPTAVRALWPVVSEKDKPSSENPKPLLHPEVDFASSVLETLRQATDEEYEDALARDAARSVMKEADPELIDVNSALNTAKNIVDVILKPKDLSDSEDGIQEASNVQESRCIHPLGSNARQPNSDPDTLLDEIFPTTKQEPLSLLNRNVWDMDSSVGASNVNEQLADSKNIMESLNLKSNPSLLNLFPNNNNNVLNSNNGFAFRNMNINKPLSVAESKPLSDLGKQMETLYNKFNKSTFDIKLKLGQPKNTLDNDALSSILHTQHIDSKFKLNPLLPVNKLEFTTKKPFTLSNLLKLKDVELIHPVKVNNNEDSGQIGTNLFKNVKAPNLSDILKNGFKFDFEDGFKGFKPITNIQSIPNDNASKFEMVDAMTSPSEIKINRVSNKLLKNENCNKDDKIEGLNKNILENSEHIKTEIIEKMPEINSRNIKVSATKNECKVNDAFDTSTRSDFQESTMMPFKKIASTEILDTVPSPSEKHQFEEELPEEMNQRIFTSQTAKNDDIDETGINVSEEKLSHEDTEDEESGDEELEDEELEDEELEDEDNSKEEEEVDEARDHGVDSVEMQQNCLQNRVEPQDSGPETSNNMESTFKPEENQKETTDLFSKTSNIDSNESCFNEDFQHADSLPETSNITPNIIPKPEEKEISSSSSHISDTKSNETCIDEGVHDDHLTKNNPKKPYDLSSLKENLLRRLDDIKNINKNLNIIKDDSKERQVSLIDSNENETDFLDDCDNKTVIPITNKNSIDKNRIAMKDLEKMSNKLLHLSSKRDQETVASETADCQEKSTETNLQFNEFSKRTGSAMINTGNVNGMIDKDNIDIHENKDVTRSLEDTDNIFETSNVHEHTDSNIVNSKEACLTDFDVSTVDEKPIKPSIKTNEMTVAASDTFEHRIKPVNHLISPLLYNNLKETSSDISKASNLPRLENARKTLPYVFETPKSNMKDFSMSKQKNINSIDSLVEADTPTLKSILPSLQPLQDVDLDIFQLKPLTLPDSRQLLPKMPKLNLNSYRAKLALPKSIDLKPMKLTSSLGDKQGLFGATLAIGSEKIPFSNTPSLLGSHLNNLPSLEELRTTLRDNAQNFIATPLETTGRNIIEDTFRSGQTFSDNIRSHTKNTVKNIQQTLETTLQGARESDLLGDSVKNPQDFLQAAARRHEDFTDKLKGIHYDLNDRLESLRDRFVEQPLFPSFSSPTMKQSSIIYKPGRDFKKDKDIFSTSSGKKSNSHFTKKSSVPRSKSQKNKTIKMTAESSVPVPKTIEVPKLKPVTFPKSSLLKKSNLKTPQLLANKKSISELLREPVSRFQNSRIPVLSRPGENKVKITFSTTPRPDFSKNKPIFTHSKLNSKSNMLEKSNIKNNPMLTSRLKPPYDTSGAPSELSTFKQKPSFSISNKPILVTEKERIKSVGRQTSKPKFNKVSYPTLKNSDRFVNVDRATPISSMTGKTTLPEGSKLRGNPMLKSVEATKNNDVLSKLREAVRAKLSNVNLKTDNKAESKSSLDMAKSASENFDTVSYVGQSLKENTSYTCKMMCTKNK